MKLLRIVLLIPSIVLAAQLIDKCKVLSGLYFDNKCYLYVNHTTKGWEHGMDYCANAVKGYSGHLAHVLSSKVLAILKDLTRPIPTGAMGDWNDRYHAFIGGKWNDAYIGPGTPGQKNARFATRKNELIDDVQVSDTYYGTLPRIDDTYYGTANYALTLRDGSQADGGYYDWEKGEFRIRKAPLYLFCQINEPYHLMYNTEIRRVMTAPLLKKYTVRNVLGCFAKCSMHSLCRGFNYNKNDGSCELTAWDPVDLAEGETDQTEGWEFFLVQ